MNISVAEYRGHLSRWIQALLEGGHEGQTRRQPVDTPEHLQKLLAEDAEALFRFERETAKKFNDERQIDLDLMLAAGNMNIEAVEDCISRGADPLAAQSNALLQAVVSWDLEMVQTLLEAGSAPGAIPRAEWEIFLDGCGARREEFTRLRNICTLPDVELVFLAKSPREYWPEVLTLITGNWHPERFPEEYLRALPIEEGFSMLLRGPQEPSPDGITYPYRLFVCQSGARGWKYSLNLEHAAMGGFFLGRHQFKPFQHSTIVPRSEILTEDEFLGWAVAEAERLVRQHSETKLLDSMAQADDSASAQDERREARQIVQRPEADEWVGQMLEHVPSLDDVVTWTRRRIGFLNTDSYFGFSFHDPEFGHEDENPVPAGWVEVVNGYGKWNGPNCLMTERDYRSILQEHLTRSGRMDLLTDLG